MSDKKAKRPLFTSPKGTIVYSFLRTPSTKFKPDGEWVATVEFNPDDENFQKFEKWVNKQLELVRPAMLEKAETGKEKAGIKSARISSPIKDSVDDDGNKTGMKYITFSESAMIRLKDGNTIDLRIDLFDSKGERLSECPNIGKNSVVKVGFEIAPYYSAAQQSVGLSVRLKAVQIIDLVEYVPEGRSASAYGFEAEDGWTADDDESDQMGWGDDDTEGDIDDAAAF